MAYSDTHSDTRISGVRLNAIGRQQRTSVMAKEYHFNLRTVNCVDIKSSIYSELSLSNCTDDHTMTCYGNSMIGHLNTFTILALNAFISSADTLKRKLFTF